MTTSHVSNALAIVEALALAFGNQPFSPDMAQAIGIGRQRIRTAEKRGHIARIHRGLYVATDPLSVEADPRARARAALAPLGDIPAVITGRLSGDLHGLPFVGPRTRLPEIGVSEIMIPRAATPRCGYRGVNAVVRRVEQLPHDATDIDGIRVTSLLHTAIDMARMGTRTLDRPRARALPLPEALVVLDAATSRLGAESPREALLMVRSLRARFRYAPGIRAVDAAVKFVDPRAENALESWSRGHMIVYGLPMPLSQAWVTGADGGDYRVDFCWPELGIVGEADGLAKYGDSPEEFRRAKSRELERQRALEEAGWIVVRWTWDELAR
ncbi:MAG: type IV toxin-antitoxin system AbiEi family antitoxin domain-containing protein, partial [Candidatus Nanopelagicales bacterium]